MLAKLRAGECPVQDLRRWLVLQLRNVRCLLNALRHLHRDCQQVLKLRGREILGLGVEHLLFLRGPLPEMLGGRCLLVMRRRLLLEWNNLPSL